MITYCIATSLSIVSITAACIFGWGLWPKSWFWLMFFYVLANACHIVTWRAAIYLVNKWSKDKPWPPKEAI